MAAVFGAIIYISAARNVYLDTCRSIEQKMNRLIGEESFLDLETTQRERFDKICFRRWGPGKITYVLMGTMFVLIYIYLSIRSCVVLAERLSAYVPWEIIITMAALLYVSLVVVLSLGAYQAVSVWKNWKKSSEQQVSKR